ncbi:C4BPA protein, partial [Grus americana]|nr:C4BPA protein [Grus americana]
APPMPAGDCGWPPRFDFAEAPVPLKESYAVGTVLNYKCRPGYTMARDKLPRVTCLSYSNWSSDSDFCIGKSCGPPDIANGIFHYTTDLLFGATITYTCNVGYRLVGKQSARCELKNNEVSWDNTPYCAIIPCLPPPEIKNGQLINRDRDFTFGMAVTYSCNKGFALIGDATIHCTTDGEFQGIWSSPAPECKVVRCKNPEVKNGRRLSGLGTEHTYENTVAFECNPGYLLNGSSVVTCEADNTWKPPLPTCDPIYCGPAPHFPFAELTRAVGDSSLAGTTLTYRCKPGYTTANGKSSVVTCLSDRTWSADPDFCIREYFCSSPPPTIANGMHNGTKGANFVQGSVVVYKCKDGFTLAGAASIHCEVDHQHHGVWSKPIPECKADVPPVGQLPDILCEEPPTIANGMHNGTKGANFVHGSTVAYKCKDGFTLAGPTFLQCMAGDQYQGVWSKPTPECRGDLSLIF